MLCLYISSSPLFGEERKKIVFFIWWRVRRKKWSWWAREGSKLRRRRCRSSRGSASFVGAARGRKLAIRRPPLNSEKSWYRIFFKKLICFYLCFLDWPSWDFWTQNLVPLAKSDLFWFCVEGLVLGLMGFDWFFIIFFFKFFVFVLGLERGSNVGGLLAVFCLACVQLSCMTSAKKKKKKNSFFFFLLREWLRLRFIVLYRKRYYFFLLNSHVIIYDSQWKSHWLLFYVD